MKKKVISLVVCAVLAVSVVSGATVAWLKDKTEKVQNTFTVGNVDIAMTETVGTEVKNTDSGGAINNSLYKMIPGAQLTKDPKVVINPGSEACWIFVKADKSQNFDNFMSFGIDRGWAPLTGTQEVYYRLVDAQSANSGISFAVIDNNTVTVKSEVTKEQLDALTATSYPTLTFSAYAIQSDNLPDGTDALGAWNLVKE